MSEPQVAMIAIDDVIIISDILSMDAYRHRDGVRCYLSRLNSAVDVEDYIEFPCDTGGMIVPPYYTVDIIILPNGC